MDIKFKVLLLLLVVFNGNFYAYSKDKNEAMPEYEISGAGTGVQGTYLVNVSVLTKDKKIDNSVIARCAVHGVLFRGFSSKEHRQTQKPLAGTPMAESQHAEFFSSFFAPGGLASSYVSEVDGSRQVVKNGKKYRVTAIVTVNKTQLRRDLEEAGVIKSLNSIF